MRHQVYKIKFKSGKDANKMLMRKLAVNFLSRGYLETTHDKAKALRPYLEKLVSKMKIYSEANKNYLLKFLGDEKIINIGFKVVGPALSKVNGGYLRLVKRNIRNSDGALKTKIEWVYPVVMDAEKPKVKVKKNEKPNLTNKIS